MELRRFVQIDPNFRNSLKFVIQDNSCDSDNFVQWHMTWGKQPNKCCTYNNCIIIKHNYHQNYNRQLDKENSYLKWRKRLHFKVLITRTYALAHSTYVTSPLTYRFWAFHLALSLNTNIYTHETLANLMYVLVIHWWISFRILFVIAKTSN